MSATPAGARRSLDPAQTVGSLLRGPIATVRPTATLREAAEALVVDDLGLLVVSDASGLRGVFSERDLVRAVAADADPAQERVRDHASYEVVTVSESATVAAAARTMADAELRHLVVTRGGEPVGVVSVRDLVPLVAELP
jgi:acetyl-CoA synthetase